MSTAITASQDDRMAAFLARARQMGALRAGADWRLYERLKADFVRDFPGASQAEYEHAMRVIAGAVGA